MWGCMEFGGRDMWGCMEVEFEEAFKLCFFHFLIHLKTTMVSIFRFLHACCTTCGIHVHPVMNKYMHTYMHNTQMHTHTHTQTHTHTHIHTHKHTHTHIHTHHVQPPSLQRFRKLDFRLQCRSSSHSLRSRLPSSIKSTPERTTLTPSAHTCPGIHGDGLATCVMGRGEGERERECM